MSEFEEAWRCARCGKIERGTHEHEPLPTFGVIEPCHSQHAGHDWRKITLQWSEITGKEVVAAFALLTDKGTFREPTYAGYERTSGRVRFIDDRVVLLDPIVFPAVPREPERCAWLKWAWMRRLLKLNRGIPRYVEHVRGIAMLPEDQSTVLMVHELPSPVAISEWQSPPIIPRGSL